MDDYFAEGSAHSQRPESPQDNFQETTNTGTDPGTEKFVIRFPQGMRHQVHQAANRNNRSMNKELVARVGHSLVNFPSVPSVAHEKLHEAKDVNAEGIMKYQSPESEILVDYRLRQTLKQLDFDRKKATLAFIEAFIA